MDSRLIVRKYVIGGIILVALILLMGFFGIVRKSAKHSPTGGSVETSNSLERSKLTDTGVATLLQYSDRVNSVNGQIISTDDPEAGNLLSKIETDGIEGDSVLFKVIFLDSQAAEVTDDVELSVALLLPEELRSSAGDTYTAYYLTSDGYSVLSSYMMDDRICCTVPGSGCVAVVKSSNSIFSNVDITQNTMYTNDTVTVRTGADTTYDAKTTLEKGTEVRVVGKLHDSEWYLVKTSEGYGYIRQDLLSESKTTSKPAQAATNKNKTTTNTQTKTNSTEPSDAQRQLDLETQQKIAEMQQIAIQQSMAENAASAPAAETPATETPAPVAETPVETPAPAPTPETPSE